MTSSIRAAFSTRTRRPTAIGSAALAAYGQISYRQHRIYLSEPYLEQLATTPGASASLAMRHGHDVVLLGFSRWRETEGHVLQGVRLPLHASALGKVFLAWSDTDGDIASLPERRPPRAPSPTWQVSGKNSSAPANADTVSTTRS
ncbi:DNA-binding IclR family transcriptional regulator [Rhodococcus opacus]|nr:DNA-binding IclR family transcriptional regulator [Rhodococcus opacus]